jgi:hypothetical protein
MTRDPSSSAKPSPGDAPGMVPHYMKTRRVAPRVIAGLVLILSIVCFAVGTSALARLESTGASEAFDELPAGESTYAIFDRDAPAQCLQTLSLSIIPKTDLEGDTGMKIKSAFRVDLAGKNVPIGAEGSASFDYQGVLTSLTTKLTIPGLMTIIATTKDPAQPMVVTVSGQAFTRSFKALTLGKIFLLEPRKGLFRLRLPSSLASPQQFSTLLKTEHSKLIFRLIGQEEYLQCQQSMLSPANPPLIRLNNGIQALGLSGIGESITQELQFREQRE